MQAQAKNVLAIAASDTSTGSIDSVVFFSSGGPAYDGRVKPDITAPGHLIMSADALPNQRSCRDSEKSGT